MSTFVHHVVGPRQKALPKKGNMRPQNITPTTGLGGNATVQNFCGAHDQPKSYGVAGLGAGTQGIGLANFAASIGTFGCTSLISKVDCPSVQVTAQRKGNLTPETSR
jgi:hypothetical protein